MLVHGWPGSFYEFYKILPLLTQNHSGVAFEVVIPSIPGYGFSEAPHKQGGLKSNVLDCQVMRYFTNRDKHVRHYSKFKPCESLLELVSLQGFNSLAASRVFLTLMERLGFSQFYVQGGDWGSLITTNMAQMKPE